MLLVRYDAEFLNRVDVWRELLILHQLLLDQGSSVPDTGMLLQFTIVVSLSLAIAGVRYSSGDVHWL